MKRGLVLPLRMETIMCAQIKWSLNITICLCAMQILHWLKDVIEVGLGCAVADQIQLASWWRSWKQSTLTASQVYKYVLVEISLRVTPSTPPCGVPIAHIVTSLLLYINICTAELLGCAADIKPYWKLRREDRSDLERGKRDEWVDLVPDFLQPSFAVQLQHVT